ncbi:extensin family protein [Tessaracoccus massiliensis]|uniref:extensin family protein n=1 Tax=Tessaracoccus massiliensis TaxID=1522311 RepID=UPI000693A710|nr:extensin family protein [Tessaracoccus massiliensis]
MSSRRALLLGAAALPLAACGRIVPDFVDDLPAPAPECREPEALVAFDTLGGAPLRYEITGTEQSFSADPAFVEQLQAWAADWTAVSGLGPLAAVSTYGAHVDKCGSWHAAGRAFDFGVLTHADGTEVSCRYDLYGDDPARLRLYWRLAASVAKHFNYTLTYRYNEQHHNHIHIDNGVSGYEPFGFNGGSRTHVSLLGNVLTWVFGMEVPGDGGFRSLADAVRQVQRANGITRPLATVDGWAAFLDVAAAG